MKNPSGTDDVFEEDPAVEWIQQVLFCICLILITFSLSSP